MLQTWRVPHKRVTPLSMLSRSEGLRGEGGACRTPKVATSDSWKVCFGLLAAGLALRVPPEPGSALLRSAPVPQPCPRSSARLCWSGIYFQ